MVQKHGFLLCDYADNFIVFAKTDVNAGTRGVTAFIVERTFPGFESKAIKGKLGIRAGNTGELFFSDVRVPVANVLGEVGEGFKIAMSALDNGRFTVAAGACGLIAASLEESVKYCHERSTFGKEIGQHQLVQQMIAKMSANLEISRLLVYKAGWLKNEGKRNTQETSLAKWISCNAAIEAANDAVQVHGAYGYSDEYPVERFLRNSKAPVIYEGTREIHTIMQGEYALGYREDKELRKKLPAWPFEEANSSLILGKRRVQHMNTYFIAGHARLPQGMAARNLYDSVTLTLEVDFKYGVIVDASCTLATDHGREFIRQLLRGYSLHDGLEDALAKIQTYYRGKANQAIQAALKDVYAQFEFVSAQKN